MSFAPTTFRTFARAWGATSKRRGADSTWRGPTDAPTYRPRGGVREAFTPGDPYFANVQLLLRGNGTDASTTVVDDSRPARFGQADGNAQVDTSDKKFGAGSWLFDGTGDLLRGNSISGFVFSGNFTIDFWVKRSDSTFATLFEIRNSILGPTQINTDAFTSSAFTISYTIPTNTWTHIECSRQSGVMYAFKDGVLQGSQSNAGGIGITDWVVGGHWISPSTVTDSLNGWMDNVRVTCGLCRHTADFTPPSVEGDYDESYTAPVSIQAYLADDGGVLGLPDFLGTSWYIALTNPGPLGDPSVLGTSWFITLANAGILGDFSGLGFTDFTAYLDDGASINYTMTIITPGGNFTLPISSFQATLQVEGQNYAACVVPGAGTWIDDIGDATEFIVYRRGLSIDGEPISNEVARATVDTVQIDNSAVDFSASLSGYTDATDTATDTPDSRYDRTISGVRSISTYASGMRLRCSIDWLLRPAQRAFYADTSFVVSKISYYVAGGDAYMDVTHEQ